MGDTVTTHRGGCHCGRVRFEVDAPEDLDGTRCNCSICAMTGFLHLIVPRSEFRLLRGEDDLQTYRFNTGIAQHFFCRHCGVKSFYVPRSHPTGISVNINCLDTATIRSVRVEPFDGHNWEQNIDKLSPIND
jgi:centromere protein V